MEESVDTHKQEQGVVELENSLQVEEIDDLRKQLKDASEANKKLEKESKQFSLVFSGFGVIMKVKVKHAILGSA